jgi:hypothetical protein
MGQKGNFWRAAGMGFTPFWRPPPDSLLGSPEGSDLQTFARIMMPEKLEIEVTINPDGTVDMEAMDHKGTACLADIGKMMHGLGKVMEERKKSEYYEQRVEVERSRGRGK